MARIPAKVLQSVVNVNSPLYTMREAGQKMRRSERTIWKLINQQQLGCIRSGRNVFVSEEQIKKYLSRNSIDP